MRLPASNETLKEYAAQADPGTESQRLAGVKAAWQVYLAADRDVTSLSRERHEDKATALLNGTMAGQFAVVHAGLDALAEFNHAQAQTRSAQSRQEYRTGCMLVLSFCSARSCSAPGAGVFITRYITGTLALVSSRLKNLQSVCITNLCDAVEAMKVGDLTHEIATSTGPLSLGSRDEFGAMARTFDTLLATTQGMIGSFRQTQASLSGLVLELQRSSAQVASASDALSAVSRQGRGCDRGDLGDHGRGVPSRGTIRPWGFGDRTGNGEPGAFAGRGDGSGPAPGRRRHQRCP